MRSSDVEVCHPPALSTLEAEHYGVDMEPNGGCPSRLLDKLYYKMRVKDPDAVLHLCSGTIKRGVTVDARAETGAQYVCDARHTPFPDESFRWIFSDPPPFIHYNSSVYGLPDDMFPSPFEILTESARLLKPGGRVCVLSMLEPDTPKGLKFLEAVAFLMGPDFYVRAAFIYEKVNRVI